MFQYALLRFLFLQYVFLVERQIDLLIAHDAAGLAVTDLDKVIALVTQHAALVAVHGLVLKQILRKVRICKALTSEAAQIEPAVTDAAGSDIAAELLKPCQAGADKDTAGNCILDLFRRLQQIERALVGVDLRLGAFLMLSHQTAAIRLIARHHRRQVDQAHATVIPQYISCVYSVFPFAV